MPLNYFYSTGCSVPELNSGYNHMQAQEVPEITLYGIFILFYFLSVMS